MGLERLGLRLRKYDLATLRRIRKDAIREKPDFTRGAQNVPSLQYRPNQTYVFI